MLVIVEGPDGSGKSTLIKQLCEKYNFEELKGIPREYPDQASFWAKLMQSCTCCKSRTYIVDRCFISELVYRCVKQDLYPNIELNRVCELLWTYRPIYVFCMTKNSYKYATERGEDYVDEKEHARIVEYYDMLYHLFDKFTHTRMVKYDFTKDTVDSLREELMEFENC